MAKGYSDEQIADELDLRKSHYNLQRWRLYCYLGDVHKPLDAVYVALQKGLVTRSELSKSVEDAIRKQYPMSNTNF